MKTLVFILRKRLYSTIMIVSRNYSKLRNGRMKGDSCYEYKSSTE